MLSNTQYEIKKEKVRKVVVTFLSGNYNIEDVSRITNISSSSVQRYLNDKEFISTCFPGEESGIIVKINEKLNNNKQEGLSRGGINYSINNDCTKDKLGHFTGSRKK